MRKFFVLLYKNILWIYACGILFFSYHLLMEDIPDHIYIREGEQISLVCSLPIQLQQSEPIQETSSFEAGSSCSMVCYLFGIFPVKEIEVSVVEEQYAYASGRVIGIYEQTIGVLVLKTTEVEDADGILVSPAENRVMSGDYITMVNQQEVNSKETLVNLIQQNGSEPLTLTVSRKGDYIDVAVKPVCTEEGNYLLGIWVKDDMAGIGTMTYYTAEGEFGALGHGIGDGETGELLSTSDGSIYQMSLMSISRGTKGAPGELQGMIYYGKNYHLGTIRENTSLGIYGDLDTDRLLAYELEDICYPVGYKQEITEGKAWILSDISGEVCSYEIEITDLTYQPEDSNKGIRLKVTDEDLLELTGGIVQGMSGSPIIQNGKLVGAVTHVLVNDPTSGYGVFIENMIRQ